VARRGGDNPLASDGRQLVPNVTGVVSRDQHLYFYYEVYDPAQPVRLLTSLAFFRGKRRVFETPVVERTALAAGRKAAVFQFDVPAASLPAGVYTCQVNVIDDAAGSFAFPRVQLLVRR
jgi:hypothetical protein